MGGAFTSRTIPDDRRFESEADQLERRSVHNDNDLDGSRRDGLEHDGSRERGRSDVGEDAR